MTQKLLAACLLLPMLYGAPVAAQEEQDLDPVTVTSTLSPVLSSRTGRNIFVIKGERFNTLPVNSIDELLRYLPGIEVQSRGPMGAQSDIVMRGGTFQQVLVLLDGIRLNDPITGHFNSYIPIAPDEIERIEILKGASSAVYGSEAVGGVVHIITRSFAAKPGTGKRQLGARVSAGDYRLFNAQAGGFYQSGKTAIGGGLLTNNARGQQQRGTTAYVHAHTASLSVSRQVNDKFRFALRSAYDDRKFAAQNFYTTFLSDTARERVRSSWNQLSLVYAEMKNTITVDAGFKTADDVYAFNSVGVANQNRSQLWQVLVQNGHKFSTSATLTTGVQFIQRSIRSNDRGNHGEQQAAFFGVLNYVPVGGLSLSPALRFDWNEQRGTELVPQLAASYRVSKWLLRGAIGKSIRDADFTERYNNYNKTRLASGRIGNPDLGAETSVNFEVGTDHFFNSHLKIGGSYFSRSHKGLIDYVPTPYAQMPRKENLTPSGVYALASNIASVTISGAEADMQFNYGVGKAGMVMATLGVLVTDASRSESASAFYLSSFARLLTNFNLVYSTPRFSISTNGLYKQRDAQVAAPIKAELTKQYFVLNGKVDASIVRNRLSLYAQVDNIFDQRYSDLLGAQMPGRWLMFGLKYAL